MLQFLVKYSWYTTMTDIRLSSNISIMYLIIIKHVSSPELPVKRPDMHPKGRKRPKNGQKRPEKFDFEHSVGYRTFYSNLFTDSESHESGVSIWYKNISKNISVAGAMTKRVSYMCCSTSWKIMSILKWFAYKTYIITTKLCISCH